MVTNVFMLSVLGLLSENRDHTFQIFCEGSGPLISRARNATVVRFLESDAEYFFSLDSDIKFDTDILPKLLSHNLPIVGAHYVGIDVTGVPFPVALVRRPSDDNLVHASYKSLGKRKGLVKVAAVGMGCTLIKREVLEALGTDILWPFAEIISPHGQALGEDTTFCIRAAEKGYDSYLDLSARVGHLKHTLL